MALLTQAELCRVVGLSGPRVSGLVKTGAFNMSSGLDVCIAKYCQDLRDKLWNREQAGGDLRAERTRHEKLKADLAEIDLAERVGKLIPVALVIEKIGAMLVTTKSKLLAIPSKCPADSRQLVKGEIRSGLTELSKSIKEAWR